VAASKFNVTVFKTILGIILPLLILAAPLPLPEAQPTERHFRIEASQFAYTPGVLRVNPGDQVTIELVATDVVHGIYIDSYELQTSADPGQTAVLNFTAGQPGVFRFRCIVPCGQMHPFMLGKLQVGPNLLFLRAVLMSVAGLLLWVLWKNPRISATS